MTDGPRDAPSEVVLETIFYPADQVRLVDWDRVSGGRAAVAVVALLTILTFVTGLSTLSQPEINLRGPLLALHPEVSLVIRFGGVLSAVVLGFITVGLRRQKRLAWYTALVMVPLVGLLPVITLESTHIPVFVVSLVAIPLLLLNHRQFTETIELSSLQIAAISAIAAALTYGTVGSYAIRDQFDNLHTWSDAVYYVLVTVATVGYGDITPLTAQARWFSLSVIIFGTGAFTAAIGALIVPAIEKRMASAFGNMTPSSLRLLEDHVLVLGYSDVTDPLLEELGDRTDVVVVTPDTDVATHLDEEGINVLTADPTDEEALEKARIDVACGVVVGTRDDAQDVLAVLSARRMNPDIRIIAAANRSRNADRLRDVGADVVISPTDIGGKLLGKAVLADDDRDARVDDVLSFGSENTE